MVRMDGRKVGLVLGTFAAVLHAAWSLLVAVGVAKPYFDWATSLHFLAPFIVVSGFNLLSAIVLVVAAFIGGNVLGWLFAWLWNRL